MIDYQPPEDKTLQIHHEDDALLVLSKPAGLLTVPGRAPQHRDCLITRVQYRYPEALVVHRLDMSTSGLLVLARNPESHRFLSRQFEQRRVDKIYQAIVTGRLRQQEGLIDLPLICDWPNRPRQVVDLQHGKPAQTGYRLLQYDPQSDTSRVELLPLTGRTHQLRVHMQSLGHAILGDDLYADVVSRDRSARLLLHATGIGFLHPLNRSTMSFEDPPPF